MEYTVKQLKKALEGIEENKLVVLEGCDCYGDWNGKIAPYVFNGDAVCLEREN